MCSTPTGSHVTSSPFIAWGLGLLGYHMKPASQGYRIRAGVWRTSIAMITATITVNND